MAVSSKPGDAMTRLSAALPGLLRTSTEYIVPQHLWIVEEKRHNMFD
jgi:hypothetical protein